KRSAYLYKDKYSKGGKLICGPFWDFNSAWYNVHACGFDVDTGWAYPMTCWVNASYPVPFWWTRLLQDSIWTRDLKCRWTTLRSTILDTTLLFHEIDSMATYTQVAATRHYAQWNFNLSWQAEVDSLKWWITKRTAWMDANMPGNCWNLGTGDDQSFDNLFHLYPNPSPGNTKLEFFLAGECEMEIEVYDITGRQIKDLGKKLYSPGSNAVDLDVSQIPAGSYFIKVDNGNLRTVKKLVVVR
ncbi:MAG TPA: T9SS type A sorting domain-containing protein, partial [Bacteroidia bacterium]